MPLRDGGFVVATEGDGRLNVRSPDQRYRVDSQSVTVTVSGVSSRFARLPALQLPDASQAMLVGRYENDLEVKREGGGLVLAGMGPEPFRLESVSPSRFRMEAFGLTLSVSFALKDGKAALLSISEFALTAARRPEQ